MDGKKQDKKVKIAWVDYKIFRPFYSDVLETVQDTLDIHATNLFEIFSEESIENLIENFGDLSNFDILIAHLGEEGQKKHLRDTPLNYSYPKLSICLWVAQNLRNKYQQERKENLFFSRFYRLTDLVFFIIAHTPLKDSYTPEPEDVQRYQEILNYEQNHPESVREK